MTTIVSFVSLKPALLQDLRRAIPDLDFRYLGDGGGRKDRRENHKEGRGESQEEAVSQADIIFGWSPLVERVLRQGRTD
ncbi:MAG: D-2-hydroxyacid dehydrogenase, partial [Parascardovia denticolens]